MPTTRKKQEKKPPRSEVRRESDYEDGSTESPEVAAASDHDRAVSDDTHAAGHSAIAFHSDANPSIVIYTDEHMKDLIGTQVLEALRSPVVVKAIVDGVYAAVYEKLATDLHNSFQLEMKKSDDKINNITIESDNLKKKVKSLEMALEKQEQYSRRQCLRVYGLPEAPNEKTDTVILDLATKMGINLAAQDIDRSHRITPRRPSTQHQKQHPKAIIVKFSRYNARSLMYGAKSRLKNTGVVIREDLTPRATRLVLQDAIAQEHFAYMVDGW